MNYFDYINELGSASEIPNTIKMFSATYVTHVHEASFYHVSQSARIMTSRGLRKPNMQLISVFVIHMPCFKLNGDLHFFIFIVSDFSDRSSSSLILQSPIFPNLPIFLLYRHCSIITLCEQIYFVQRNSFVFTLNFFTVLSSKKILDYSIRSSLYIL